LQIVTKEVPVTEKAPEKSRKGLYRIEDNFFNFWFRFVFRNRDLLEEGRREEVLKIIKREMREILPRNYEKVSLELLKGAVGRGELGFHLTRYGRWWEKGEEIDIVGINPDTKEILFAEAKWRNRPVGINIYEDLKRKSRLVDWHRERRREYYALFSKSGFTEKMKRMAKEEGIFLFEKGERLI
jgi:hypothetical protein